MLTPKSSLEMKLIKNPIMDMDMDGKEEERDLEIERAEYVRVVPEPMRMIGYRRRFPELRSVCLFGACQVLEVRIIGENKPSHLYGTIRAYDGVDIECIYLREKNNMEAIGDEGILALMDLQFGIDPSDTVEFKFDLKSPDGLQVISGTAGTDYVYSSYLFGMLITEKIEGDVDNVTAEISYISFEEWAEANVQVNLFLSKETRLEEGWDELYGRITAYGCNSPMHEKKVPLLSKERNESLKLEPPEPFQITLDRSKVFVPLGSPLAVDVDLKHCDGRKLVRERSIRIRPKAFGMSATRFRGKFGTIEVKVNWISKRKRKFK